MFFKSYKIKIDFIGLTPRRKDINQKLRFAKYTFVMGHHVPSHTHTRTHTLSHTPTLSFTHRHTHYPIHTHLYIRLSLSFKHTHTPGPLSFSLTHAFSLSSIFAWREQWKREMEVKRRKRKMKIFPTKRRQKSLRDVISVAKSWKSNQIN